jgi:hypothetical protein
LFDTHLVLRQQAVAAVDGVDERLEHRAIHARICAVPQKDHERAGAAGTTARACVSVRACVHECAVGVWAGARRIRVLSVSAAATVLAFVCVSEVCAYVCAGV